MAQDSSGEWALILGASSGFGRATALELARSIGARNVELAASLQLAQLWCEAGRRDEARAFLSPVVESFSEGFDRGDLFEATKLLEELATS